MTAYGIFTRRLRVVLPCKRNQPRRPIERIRYIFSVGYLGGYKVIYSGDTISLAFDNPGNIFGGDYKFVMKVEGSYQISKTREISVDNAVKPADSSLLPIVFSFDQNYPNPFNPSTTFRFSIPKTSRVQLNIFNILGQRVETVIDDNYEPGYYDYHWNNTDLGTGVYFAKFTAGEYKSTRKVVILK